MRVCPNCAYQERKHDGFAWRNDRWRMYNQICRIDELPPKLQILLNKHHLAFDDEFWYVLSTKNHTTVSKIPLWQTNKYGYMETEMYVPFDPNQRRLDDIIPSQTKLVEPKP